MNSPNIQYQKPPKIQYGPIPVIFENPNKEDQEKKINYLKKVVEIQIGVNIVFGVILFFLIFLFITWRFDLRSYFQKQPAQQAEQVGIIPPDTTEQRVSIAQAASSSPIYINEQAVDIEKAFQAPSDNIKLAVNGSLKKEVFGFLPYWVLDNVDDINTKLLTSVSFFGLEVDGGGNIIKTDSSNKVITPWFYFQNGPRFEKFAKRLKQSRIKVYITLKCFNQANITKLTTDPSSREAFINNALFLMNSKSLDGINLDFEYIGTPPKNVIDGFSLLVINLNNELKRQYPKAILTIDTFVDAASNTRIHDIPILAQNSDGLVIMGYDFHTPDSPQAGPISPLEGYGNSLLDLMNNYLEKAPPEKLILAVPYYGYDWPVENNNGRVLGSAADVKIYSYAEIAEASKRFQINWDENAKTPWYSYTDPKTKLLRVTYFENPRSLGIKYDFILQKNLQGVGLWALGFDGKRNDLNQLLSDKFSK